MTKELINSAMIDYARGAREVYGNKLKEVILFGSCARGDFKDGSDVDVMILLDVPKEEEKKERNKIYDMIYTLDEKYGYELLFSTIVKSYNDFNKWIDTKPFYMNIKREGVRYV